MTAVVANKGMGVPAYKAGSYVQEYTTGKNDAFVRFYTEGQTKPEGNWMMKFQDVKGLNPEQIQVKNGMPNTPTHMVDVNPPVGTTVRMGTAGPGFVPNGGGGNQYELMENIPTSSFTNPIEIPEVTTAVIAPMIEIPIVEPEIPIIDPIIP